MALAGEVWGVERVRGAAGVVRALRVRLVVVPGRKDGRVRRALAVVHVVVGAVLRVVLDEDRARRLLGLDPRRRRKVEDRLQRLPRGHDRGARRVVREVEPGSRTLERGAVARLARRERGRASRRRNRQRGLGQRLEIVQVWQRRGSSYGWYRVYEERRGAEREEGGAQVAALAVKRRDDLPCLGQFDGLCSCTPHWILHLADRPIRRWPPAHRSELELVVHLRRRLIPSIVAPVLARERLQSSAVLVRLSPSYCEPRASISAWSDSSVHTQLEDIPSRLPADMAFPTDPSCSSQQPKRSPARLSDPPKRCVPIRLPKRTAKGGWVWLLLSRARGESGRPGEASAGEKVASAWGLPQLVCRASCARTAKGQPFATVSAELGPGETTCAP